MTKTEIKHYCDLCKKEAEIVKMKVPTYRTFDSCDGRTFYKKKQFCNEELDLCEECLDQITKIHSIGVCCNEYEMG